MGVPLGALEYSQISRSGLPAAYESTGCLFKSGLQVDWGDRSMMVMVLCMHSPSVFLNLAEFWIRHLSGYGRIFLSFISLTMSAGGTSSLIFLLTVFSNFWYSIR